MPAWRRGCVTSWRVSRSSDSSAWAPMPTESSPGKLSKSTRWDMLGSPEGRKTNMKSFLVILLSAVALASAGASAQAPYPDRPVRIIVPFPAGGPADALARIVGDRLSQSLGKAFVVENKAGAGGNIGMEQGARAAPDGYTLTLAPVGNLTIAPSLYSKLPYDPVRDYAPITVLAAVPNVLIVHPSVPARTLGELIALAKAKPGTLNYASPGNGSGAHLEGELLKSMAGVGIGRVPYTGF